MALSMFPTRAMPEIAAVTTAGLLVYRPVILLRYLAGRQARLVAESGAIPGSRATGQTCLSLLGTRSAPAVLGEVVKRSSDCGPARLSTTARATTGRRRIGLASTMATRMLAVAAQS